MICADYPYKGLWFVVSLLSWIYSSMLWQLTVLVCQHGKYRGYEMFGYIFVTCRWVCRRALNSNQQRKVTAESAKCWQKSTHSRHITTFFQEWCGSTPVTYWCLLREYTYICCTGFYTDVSQPRMESRKTLS